MTVIESPLGMPGRTRFDEPYERVELRLRRGLRSHPDVRRALLALANLRPTIVVLESSGALLIDRKAMDYARCVGFTVARLRGAFSYDEIDRFARTVHRDLAIERGASDPQLRHGRVPISMPVGSLVDRYGRKAPRKRRGPTDAEVDSAVDAMAKSLARGRRGEPDDLDVNERQAISRVMLFIDRPEYRATERDRRIRPAVPSGPTGPEAAAAEKRNAEAARTRRRRQAQAASNELPPLQEEAGRLHRWTQEDFDKLADEWGLPREAFGTLDAANGIYTGKSVAPPSPVSLPAAVVTAPCDACGLPVRDGYLCRRCAWAHIRDAG